MGNTESTQRLRTQAGRTPVRELRETSREILAELLDRRGRVHNGRLNDYRGLMEEAHCTQMEISEHRQEPSPTQSFLRKWERLATSRGHDAPTILDLWRILEVLGRHDVIQAAHQRVGEDIRVYHQTQPVQYRHVDRCITHHDVQNNSRIRYDAFVMSVQSDLAILRKLITIAEVTHGLNLLVPERDILYGLPEYDTWAYAIERRCKKLILLISRGFNGSERCEFVVKFAQALSPAARNMKIIPIRVDDAEIPTTLNFVRCFSLSRNNCWDLLISAIRAPSNMERSVSCPVHVAMVPPMSRGIDDRVGDTLGAKHDCSKGLSRLSINERHSTPETIYRRRDGSGGSEQAEASTAPDSSSQPNVPRNPPVFHLASDTEEDENVISRGSSFCCIDAGPDCVFNNLNMFDEESVEDNVASLSRIVGDINESANNAERSPLPDNTIRQRGDSETNIRRDEEAMRWEAAAFDSADGRVASKRTRSLEDERPPRVLGVATAYRRGNSVPDRHSVNSGNNSSIEPADLLAFRTDQFTCSRPNDQPAASVGPNAAVRQSSTNRDEDLTASNAHVDSNRAENPELIIFV